MRPTAANTAEAADPLAGQTRDRPPHVCRICAAEPCDVQVVDTKKRLPSQCSFASGPPRTLRQTSQPEIRSAP